VVVAGWKRGKNLEMVRPEFEGCGSVLRPKAIASTKGGPVGTLMVPHGTRTTHPRHPNCLFGLVAMSSTTRVDVRSLSPRR
jgi:hypothetical protein